MLLEYILNIFIQYPIFIFDSTEDIIDNNYFQKGFCSILSILGNFIVFLLFQRKYLNTRTDENAMDG